MKTRTITAVILAVFLIPLLIWGDHFHLFDLFGLVLSLGAAWEFRRMYHAERPLPLWIDILTILATGVVYMMFLWTASSTVWWTILPALILVILIIYGILLVLIDDFKGQDFGNALTTMLYCSIGFASLAILRGKGLDLVVFMILAAMITDMFAYFVGMTFGKHKMIPKVSPKKTVEGGVGGLVFGTVSASVFGIVFHVFGPDFPAILVVVIALVLSVISQIGDLVASKFKRSYGIKDYSNLFPGHGGIMDRFDSTLFTAMALLAILSLLVEAA